MENCIFCKIATGEIPADVVYEDDELMAFKDIRPAAPVHVLIIPKIHIASLADCDKSHTTLLGKMLTLAPQLAREQGCELHKNAAGDYEGGFKTQIHTGTDGGQEIYHLHVHVMGGPRPWRGSH